MSDVMQTRSSPCQMRAPSPPFSLLQWYHPEPATFPSPEVWRPPWCAKPRMGGVLARPQTDVARLPVSHCIAPYQLRTNVEVADAFYKRAKTRR